MYQLQQKDENVNFNWKVEIKYCNATQRQCISFLFPPEVNPIRIESMIARIRVTDILESTLHLVSRTLINVIKDNNTWFSATGKYRQGLRTA